MDKIQLDGVPAEGDLEQLNRIEAKLDTLIAALASDDEDEPQFTLDGDLMPPDRAEGQPL